MSVRVGTFNLNNLFSRFNFQANVRDNPLGNSGGLTLSFSEDEFIARTFNGSLIKEKNQQDTETIAHRIRQVMNADVLAVQEVEHIMILKQFNRQYLNGMYRHLVLVEGNDSRFIDVGILSRLPLGAVTSHQTATHPDDPARRVFSRDLLQVEVLDERGNKLFNLYNTHLKSNFVPFFADQVEGARSANLRRARQAQTIGRILSKVERPGSRFLLTGDMNDPPESPYLQDMLIADNRPLVNVLADAQESRPAKAETRGQGNGPVSPVWTHRFNPAGPAVPRYELLDQIWASQSLAPFAMNPMIDRRTRHGGDGSDHDPAWIDLNL
ncbi:MAG: endonuclease/exonuclease/phosphatase family protein [Granulosicoccus sp.]